MNIDVFVGAIKRSYLLIIVWIVVLVVIALIATWRLPQTYEAGGTATAIHGTDISQASVNYYLYDNYYSIQSGAFIADDIVSWLASPPMVAAIYKDAGVSQRDTSVKALAKIFTSKKQSATSNVATYTVSDTNPDNARRLILSANKSINAQVADINKDQKDKAGYFSINFTEPVVVKPPKGYLINSIVAGALGLIFSLAIALYRPAPRS